MAIKRLMAKALPDYLVNQVTLRSACHQTNVYFSDVVRFSGDSFFFFDSFKEANHDFWRSTSVITPTNRIRHGRLSTIHGSRYTIGTAPLLQSDFRLSKSALFFSSIVAPRMVPSQTGSSSDSAAP